MKNLDIIYNYIKNNYKTLIYGNPKVILEEIKYQVKPLTYNKIENLYMQFKDKIDNFTKNIKRLLKPFYILTSYFIN